MHQGPSPSTIGVYTLSTYGGIESEQMKATVFRTTYKICVDALRPPTISQLKSTTDTAGSC